jgi:hypothetical protein
VEHPGHRHLVARPGARVAERADGKWLVQEPFGMVVVEDAPDVPWYVCAIPPNQTCGAPTRPYGTPPAGGPNPDNPPAPGAALQTDNVTRHWAAVMASVPYWMSVPSYAPMGVNTNIFANVPSSPVSYTYADFANDVSAMLNVITSHPNIALGPAVSFGTINTTYEPPFQNGIAPQTMGNGSFVWDTCMLSTPTPGSGNPSYAGPTWNSINEFIFLNNTLFPTSGDLTSMIVDPMTGQILECDVLFDARAATAGFGAGSLWNPTPLRGPRFVTAIAHGIGHFFGLDHTNLHPGIPSMAVPTSAAVTPLAGYPASLGMNYASTQTHHLPMMLGFHTATSVNYIAFLQANGLHPDDAAGLAQIYPVPTLTLAAGKIPLGNTTATIQGVVRNTAGTPLWGPNVYPIQHLSGTSGLTKGAPTNGKIAGTARLSPLSVVGSQNTTTGSLCTGEFRMEGIPVPIGSTVQLDVVGEALECIGIGVGRYSEWIQEVTINPAPQNTWVPLPPAACQGGWITNGSLAVPSLAVTAGSVVTLAGSLTVGAPPSIERASRPLVEISPRTSIPTTIVVVSFHTNDNPAINPLAIRFTVNGTLINIAGFLAGTGPSPLFPGGFVSTYHVPAAVIGGSPATVVAMATETSTGGALQRVAGMNKVQY